MDIETRALSLFLDFDGTLIDIASRPDAVTVPQDLLPLLSSLHGQLNGAVAIVSGRPLPDLLRLLPQCPVALVAEHGAIIRTPQGRQGPLGRRRTVPKAVADHVRSEIAGLDGVLLEEKQSCLTVHYRQAPEHHDAIEAILTRAMLRWPAFRISTAKMALELRPRGLDKGTAVQRLMQFEPYRGRVPLFIGDDATDEDGIRACLLMGGRGMRVPQDFGGGPEAVRRWLWSLTKPVSAVTGH